MSTPARILVVCDADSSTDASVRALPTERFDVTTVHDTAAVCAAASDTDPSLVLLDLQMPGYGGFEVAGRLAVDHPGIPVLYLVGAGPHEQLAQGFLLGDDLWLRSPAPPEELARRLDAALRDADLASASAAAVSV